MEIADLLTTPTNTASATNSVIESDLDRDAFLQLLVTELKYQDPMEPMDNKESIAQLAQFSALEQMQNLNTSFEKYFGSGMTAKASALNALGGKATGMDEASQAIVSGVVKSVSFEEDQTVLVLDDGSRINFNNVSMVTMPGA